MKSYTVIDTHEEIISYVRSHYKMIYLKIDKRLLTFSSLLLFALPKSSPM